MMNLFAATEIHISLSSETLFTVFGFPITNAMVTGALGLIILLLTFGYVTSKIKRGQTNFFVGLVRWGYEGMMEQINNIISDKKLARRIAPLALTIFFFVLISYWMSVLPGLDSIKWNGVPVLRSIAADLNFTFALAIISLVTVQAYAIKRHGGFGNLKRYLRNPFKNPIGAFEGFLELIGEISRYTALSLRLFGNCFAGEILLIIIAVLTSYFSAITLPIFLGFELFIGFIQAYVFFMLTVIFTSLALESHDTSHDHSPEPKKLAPENDKI